MRIIIIIVIELINYMLRMMSDHTVYTVPIVNEAQLRINKHIQFIH